MLSMQSPRRWVRQFVYGSNGDEKLSRPLRQLTGVAFTILLTEQGYDLRCFSGPIDPAKGTYHDQPRIARALRRLYEMLGQDEGQIVWFFQEGPRFACKPGCYLHKVDVDERDIVCVVNGFVWHHIIRDERYIPERHQRELHHAAANAAELREKEDAYLRGNLPGDLWASVRRQGVQSPEDPEDQVLVRFPFTFSRVIDVQQVTEAMAKAIASGRSLYGAGPARRV
jgi:hypothetical protein